MTLRYLNQIIKDWWSSHAQINHVYFGSQDDYMALANKQYASVAIEYLQSNTQAKSIVHQFRFTLSDLYNPNIENHDLNIYSTLLSIVEDFDMFLRLSDDFTIQNNLSIVPFSDDTKDRTSGYVFNINVAIPRVINECMRPVKTPAIDAFDVSDFTNPEQ